MLLEFSLHDSIVVSIPACHAGDRGSIPRRGAFFISVIIFIRQKISSGMKKVVIWHFYPSDFGNRNPQTVSRSIDPCLGINF